MWNNEEPWRKYETPAILLYWCTYMNILTNKNKSEKRSHISSIISTSGHKINSTTKEAHIARIIKITQSI
jgi:hypothetical protein